MSDFYFYIDLIISFEQASYIALENTSSATGFEVCVVILNGPGIVPQMNMNVIIFATNGSDGGNLKYWLCSVLLFMLTTQTQQRLEWTSYLCPLL